MQKRLPDGDLYLRSLPAAMVLAGLYFICGKVTLSFATLTGYITPVWPVSGIALAALLLFGRRLAPGIFIGALALHLASHGVSGLNLIGGSSIGLGNMLTTALLADLVQRKINVDQLLARSRHVFWFVGLILPIPIISATIGVTVLYLTGIIPLAHFGPSWWTWSISNLFGILIVTPAMVAWRPRGTGQIRPNGQRLAEVLLMTGLIIAIYSLSFFANTQFWHLLIPILIWSAFRFGPRGTTLLIVLISTMEVIRIVYHSRGGVPLEPPMAMNSALLLFQSFIGVITLTTLILTAVIAERRHAEQGLVSANSELNTLTRLLQDSNAALTQANDELESRVEVRTRDLRQEREKSESLLLNILPKAIAERLKHEPRPIANAFDEVTVLFADIVNFSEVSSHVSARQLVQILNQIFSAFDHLSAKYGVEKIKTIGDAYMAVAGVPEPCPHHADIVAQMALEMLQVIQALDIGDYQPRLRIGLNTGPVVAGVIGTQKFIYDLWGDTVNVASRMESLGEPNRIQMAEGTYQRLSPQFVCKARGQIEVKGKGLIPTYWLVGIKP
jgi:class 3 adenylate cyclase/integral membrane sensor domain MASE1